MSLQESEQLLEYLDNSIASLEEQRAKCLAEMQQLGYNTAEAYITEWYKLDQRLKVFKENESTLRKKAFELAFPEPVEGTNKFSLPDGWQLTATYPFTRTLDYPALSSAEDKLHELNINVDMLVDFKPSLKKSYYTLLNDEQREEVDNFLTTKAGSPAFKVVQPKKGK